MSNESKWLSIQAWDACAAEPVREGICVAGLDLASTKDITALVCLWPETQSVECHFFVPEEGITRRSRDDRVPYDVWARQGLLDATEGNRTDYEVVRKRLHELRDKYELDNVFVDRWNASHLSNQLQDDGFHMVEVPPSMNHLSAPSKELETMVADGKLRHDGNPVLRWMADNVALKTDSEGNVRPSREKSGEKIDGIVALILAIKGAKAVRQTVADPRGGEVLVI